MDLTKLIVVSDSTGDQVRAELHGREIGTDDKGNRLVETEGSNGSKTVITIDKHGDVINSQVSDSLDSACYRAAEFAIDNENLMDLWTVGKTVVNMPSFVDADEFAHDCIDIIEDLWDEPEINYSHGAVKFGAEVTGTTITIFVK